MAVPDNGPISILGIRRELGNNNYNSSTTYSGISIQSAETGSYGTINTNSPYRPDGVVVRSFSEWYEYDHDFSPPSFLAYTFYYHASSTSTLCNSPGTPVTVYTPYISTQYSATSQDIMDLGIDIYANSSNFNSFNYANDGYYRPTNSSSYRYFAFGNWGVAYVCNDTWAGHITSRNYFRYKVDSNIIKPDVSNQVNGNWRSRTDTRVFRLGNFDSSILIDDSLSAPKIYLTQNFFNDPDDKYHPSILAVKDFMQHYNFNPNTVIDSLHQTGAAVTWEPTPNISVGFSDICFIESSSSSPSKIFFVTHEPLQSFSASTLYAVYDHFYFGALPLSTNVNSSITYPELYWHNNFTKKFTNLNTQSMDKFRVGSSVVRPCVSSFYYDPPAQSPPGSPPSTGTTYVYIAGQCTIEANEIGATRGGVNPSIVPRWPYIFSQVYTERTLSASTSSNIFTNQVVNVWDINEHSNHANDIFTGFRSIEPIEGGTYDYVGAVTSSNYGSGTPASLEGACLLMYPYGGYGKHFKFRQGTVRTIPHSITGDGSGNMYIAGLSHGVSSDADQIMAFLIKTNGSTLTWSRILRLNLYQNSTGVTGWGHVVYGGGKVFVCTQQPVDSSFVDQNGIYENQELSLDPGAYKSNGLKFVVAKYSTSGTLELIKTLTLSSPTDLTKAQQAGITDMKYADNYLFITYINGDYDTSLAYIIKMLPSNLSITSSAVTGLGIGDLLNQTTAPGYTSVSFTSVFNSYTNGSGDLKTFSSSDYQLNVTGVGDDYTDRDNRWGGYGGRRLY